MDILIRRKRTVGKNVCNDIVLAKIQTEKYPKLTCVDIDTGEENVPRLLPKYKDITIELSILLDVNGLPIYPQNWYLHHKVSKELNSDVDTASKALLAYTRWLSSKGCHLWDFTENPEEGVLWGFRDYLADNLRVICEETDEVMNDGISVSTARNYINIIVNFYKWMSHQRIFQITDERKPFNVITVRYRKEAAETNHDILAHIRSNRMYVTDTTDLMAGFAKVRSTKRENKLKPITQENQLELLEVLSSNDGIKSLMVRLSMTTGLRIAELVTLPEAGILQVSSDILKVSISPQCGCKTKGGRARIIEIPRDIAQELYEYRFSNTRTDKLKKINVILDKNTNCQVFSNGDASINPHGRLFVANHGEKFSENTLETYFSYLRKKIREIYPHWYYRFHDLRATFATNWLFEKYTKRGLSYDYWLGELQELMGHSSPKVTQMYIDFMNHNQTWIAHSGRKNEQAAKAWKGSE